MYESKLQLGGASGDKHATLRQPPQRRNCVAVWLTSPPRKARWHGHAATSLAGLLTWVCAATPVCAQWTIRANMPGGGRIAHVAMGGENFNGDPRVFVFAGQYAGQNATAVDAYHPIDGWDPANMYAAMPSVRYEPAIAADGNGLIYVIGGNSGNVWLKTVDVYDTGANTWFAIPPMVNARQTPGAAFDDIGNLYVIGGQVGGGNALNVVEMYNPSTGVWIPKPSLPLAHRSVGAARGCDGRIYVVGGRDNADQCPSGGSATYAYDPITNAWTPAGMLADMPGCLGGRGVTIGPDQRIYAINDRDYDICDTRVFSYDTATDTWRAEFGTTYGFVSLAAAMLDDEIYALGGSYRLGGQCGQGNYLRNESLGPITTSPIPFISDCLTSNRFDLMPDDTLQVVVAYDGMPSATPELCIECTNGTSTEWIHVNGIVIFGTAINTYEFDLNGYHPTGHFDISGTVPNGGIDGLAFGILWKQAGRYHVLKSATNTSANFGSDFIGAWPITLTDAQWSALTPQLNAPVCAPGGPGGFDEFVIKQQARTVLYGAQLLADGFYKIGIVNKDALLGDLDEDCDIDLDDYNIFIANFSLTGPGAGCPTCPASCP